MSECKTNGGIKSVCSSCSDETSTVKEDRGNRSQKRPCAFIFHFFGGEYPAKKARNGDDLGLNRGLPPIDAKTLPLMEIASASQRKLCISRDCK